MGLAKEFTKGLWEIIPPFRLVLGLCPTLAVTTSIKNGVGMGLATTFVLICSNVFISLLRKVIPSKVRIAAYIVIIASFVVIVELLMHAFAFDLYKALGMFIPLIVVNCIILGRAEAFAAKNGPVPSLLDGAGVGLGFTISLGALGSFREIVGAGTWLSGLDKLQLPDLTFHPFGTGYEPFAFMVAAPGAFVGLGLMLAMINLISRKLEDRKARS